MLANSTEKVARFIVFGSFVTAKPIPGDVDIFLLMEDSFDADQVYGEAAFVFNHQEAQSVLGASVFLDSQIGSNRRRSGSSGILAG